MLSIIWCIRVYTSVILCVSLPRQVKVCLRVVDISLSAQCWKSLSLLFWALLLQTDKVDGGDTCSCLEHLGTSWNILEHLGTLFAQLDVSFTWSSRCFRPPSHFAWATTEFPVHPIMQKGKANMKYSQDVLADSSDFEMVQRWNQECELSEL